MTDPGQRSAADEARAGRFNHRCQWAALLWLVLCVGVGQLLRPGEQDFGQYYMGGLIARVGEWQALYPDPIPGSALNAGWAEGSVPKPRYLQLAQGAGAKVDSRFIQSPLTALLLIPLSWMPFETAHAAWLGLLCVAGWRVAIQAGRVLQVVERRPTRRAGILVLLVACSPLMYRSVRVGNVSPLVAWCIGAVILDLLRGRARGGVAGGVIGSLLKYVPALLLIVAAIRRNWRLAGGGALGLLLTGGACWLIGSGQPMREFVRFIVPTLGNSSPWRGNQSLQGMLLRMAHSDRMGHQLAVTVSVLQWGVLLAMIWAILLRGRTKENDAGFTLGACAALLAWLMIFAPVAWEHYYVYFCPLWGWLLWPPGQTVYRRGAGAIAVCSQWVPWPLIRGRILQREPLTSIMFLGAAIILAAAMISLVKSRRALRGRAGHEE